MLVSVPNQHWINHHVVYSLFRLQQDQRYEITITLPVNRPVEISYSACANRAYRERFHYWLNIDSDNPPIKNPLDLIKLGKDVIACPTPIWKADQPHKPILYNAYKYHPDCDGYSEWAEQDGLQKVDAVGMGCTLIDTRVFAPDDMRRHAFRRVFNEDGSARRSTDIAFCEKLRSNGFEVWAHYDYPAMHFKEMELTETVGLISEMAEQFSGRLMHANRRD